MSARNGESNPFDTYNLDKLRVQMQQLQWRKRMTNTKIRGAIQSSRASAERELVDQLAIDRSADSARWRLAVIEDEMARPLAIDVETMQRLDDQARRVQRQEANDAKRHLKTLTWLEFKLKSREPVAGPAAIQGTSSPSHDGDSSTYSVMKNSLQELTEKVKHHNATTLRQDLRLRQAPRPRARRADASYVSQ